MKRFNLILAILTTIAISSIFGCSNSSKNDVSTEKTAEIAPFTKIGELAEVFSVDTIPVVGYGIVDGLNGQGSSECPPLLRSYLEQYILKQVAGQRMNAGNLIDSLDTAVVEITGNMPLATAGSGFFDVKVKAIEESQTQSLENGWIYGAELRPADEAGMPSKAIAEVSGPIFQNKIGPDKSAPRTGYILAGGRVLDKYMIRLILKNPDYNVAGDIRNEINNRFGPKIANAVSPGEINVLVPPRYTLQKTRFIDLLKNMRVYGEISAAQAHITTLVAKLATAEEKYPIEIELEAMGNLSFDKLSALLSSSDEKTRFHAARCMLNLGSPQALETLRDIAFDTKSQLRIDSLNAIATEADRSRASGILRRLLNDDNTDVRIAAYQQLIQLEDLAVERIPIGRSFYLDLIATQSDKKTIWVSRSGRPRIAIFGYPIYCEQDVFIKTEDGRITLNSPEDQDFVSIIIKHPRKPDKLITVETSYKLSDIIKTLCEEPIINNTGKDSAGGLNFSYSDIISLLEIMHEKKAFKGEFVVGEMPQID